MTGGAGPVGWWALEIDCRSELAKAVLWRLSGPGHRCCSVHCDGERTAIHAFVSRTSVPPEEIAELYVGLHLDASTRGLPAPHIEWREVDTWEWPEHHKQLLRPVPIGRNLLIQPHWMSTGASDRVTVRIDSRHGFGAGTHPTTRLALEALERRLQDSPGLTIADIGCGCGVLSLTAILLGAKQVNAVDTKSASVTGTNQNRELNGIAAHRLVPKQGSVKQLRRMMSRPVDGFVCNIRTPVIVGLIPSFVDISAEWTWGILSGILEAEMPELDRPLECHGWDTTNVTRQGGWCCIEISRADRHSPTSYSGAAKRSEERPFPLQRRVAISARPEP